MEALIDPVVAKTTTDYEALNAFVPLRPISSKGDYAEAVAALNQLLDAGAADEGHPLAGLANTFGELISTYEDAHALSEKVAPATVLRLLMDQHSLSQSDLPDILQGKRARNMRQIRALAARFNVPASVFV